MTVAVSGPQTQAENRAQEERGQKVFYSDTSPADLGSPVEAITPFPGDLLAQHCYPKCRKCGSWVLRSSSCSQAERGTAVLPAAVSLVKEKHPANSIKNVSQNAGEGSVSSAILCPGSRHAALCNPATERPISQELWPLQPPRPHSTIPFKALGWCPVA